MGIIDWLVIATFGCLTMAVGAYYSRQHQSADDFLLGGRTMSPIALGLSLDKPNRSDQPGFPPACSPVSGTDCTSSPFTR